MSATAENVVIILDSDGATADWLAAQLPSADFSVTRAESPAMVLALAEEEPPWLMVLDGDSAEGRALSLHLRSDPVLFNIPQILLLEASSFPAAVPTLFGPAPPDWTVQRPIQSKWFEEQLSELVSATVGLEDTPTVVDVERIQALTDSSTELQSALDEAIRERDAALAKLKQSQQVSSNSYSLESELAASRARLSVAEQSREDAAKEARDAKEKTVKAVADRDEARAKLELAEGALTEAETRIRAPGCRDRSWSQVTT